MPKHDYRGATPETMAAIDGHLKQIADEWDVSPQYLYAILSGKETDPFKFFLTMFRAVCRKNPEGARGFVARLQTMLKAEAPQKSEAVGMQDATRTFAEVLSVSAELEEGMCPPEKFEQAKARHAEVVEKVTVYAPSSHMRNLG